MFAGNFGQRPSISSQFTIQQPKIAKIHLNHPISGLKVIQVTDVNSTKKHITSACYDK